MGEYALAPKIKQKHRDNNPKSKPNAATKPGTPYNLFTREQPPIFLENNRYYVALRCGALGAWLGEADAARGIFLENDHLFF